MQLAQINHSAIDRWTLGHAGVGLLYGVLKVPWWAATILAVGWEVVERPLKRNIPRMFPHASQDTFMNALFDVIAVMVGWGAGRLLRSGINK